MCEHREFTIAAVKVKPTVSLLHSTQWHSNIKREEQDEKQSWLEENFKQIYTDKWLNVK